MKSVVGANGRPEFATNDASASETVADAIKDMLSFTRPYEDTGRSVAIASAFFNVGGWHLISDELKRVGRVRIMLGAEPQRQTDPVVLRSGTVPSRKARAIALNEALQEQYSALAVERDIVPFTAEARVKVTDFISWLRGGNVDVRRYTKEFLHGKAYLIDSPQLGVIAGSSNFTYAGLATNRELNLGQYQPGTINAVKEWFDDLWDTAEPFDLAAFYEQQVIPDEPWIVFLRMLWEAYGRQMAQDDEELATDPSMRDLLTFQKDGVGRARRILAKHNGVLVADEVGLGKTYVGGALVKDTARARQRTLIVAPKIIRDTVWKRYVDDNHLAGWVDCISYDDLLAEKTPDGRLWRLDIARNPDEYSLVLLDEAHTVRNSDTGRSKALIEILKGNPRKRVVLLTATPVNNTLGDLHSLLSYFIVHDDEFAELGIPSLSQHFRELDRLDPDALSPEKLFDILDAVAVRRTRQFVRNHYVGQKIDKTGETLVFPEPVVRRVDYDLSPVLAGENGGFFATFAHALSADRDTDEVDPFLAGTIPEDGLSSLDDKRLTLAGYTPTRYRTVKEDGDRRQRAAEVQVSGLLRSGLLKRLESSTMAFILTCRKMAMTLEGLLDLIRSQGYVASGASLREWIKVELEDDVAFDSWRENADYEPAELYNTVALTADIENDMKILRSLADHVEKAIAGTTDPKFDAISEMLIQVLAEADRDTRLRAAARLSTDPEADASRARDDRKVLVFSYYADTINYLQDHIHEILSDPRLEKYRDRVAFVTGTGRKAKTAFRSLSVEQDVAVAGFAPKTGGPTDDEGNLLSEDKYDLLFSTDVLSQGVNLQQARNIASVDLPWNPQVLVQRHGRIDRIGSDHPRIYLWCFFPDVGLEQWLGLEAILHRKLAKAAASIGHGHVLPGVAASEDRVFNAKAEQIRAIQHGDTALFIGQDPSLISGEEFRAMLRKAIENASLERALESMPWGVGSGFVTNDRSPGYVFCARILDRVDEPVFRYIPLPGSLIPGTTTAATPEPNPDALALLEEAQPEIRGVPVTVIRDSLTSLTMASPPQTTTPAHLPEEWIELAYDAWSVAQGSIADMWNKTLDTNAAGPSIPPAIAQAMKHIRDHSESVNTDDADRAIKVYRRGQASRVTAIVRAVMRDELMTPENKTARLIELVDELGLVEPEARERRYPITADDVRLITWTAIIPESQ